MKRTAAGQPEVSPSSYKAIEGKKYVHTSESRYSIPKEKGRSFIQKVQKDKAFVPAPNSYNLDKGKNFITLGARKGYK